MFFSEQKISARLKVLCIILHLSKASKSWFSPKKKRYRWKGSKFYGQRNESACKIVFLNISFQNRGASLTLNLLTTTTVSPPSNAGKWQMGFNSAFNP